LPDRSATAAALQARPSKNHNHLTTKSTNSTKHKKFEPAFDFDVKKSRTHPACAG